MHPKETKALAELIRATNLTAKKFLKHFNDKNLPQDTRIMLNDLAPTLITIKMQLQDKMRSR